MKVNKTILKFMNFWPPFLGSGIKIKSISKDFTRVEVEAKLKFWNANYIGTQYGGTMFSMTDPFYMLMILNRLDENYIVWDKSASIKFIKPGRSKIHAVFELTDERFKEIQADFDDKDKIEPIFKIPIYDENNDLVAEVERTIYIRKKNIAAEKK